MTLKELLMKPEFSRLTLINREGDLERTVLTVESTETPDVAAYLPGNSLLLTTGMAFKDRPEEFLKFIQSLNDISCIGLAIKLGRFLDELAPEVIALADKLKFPLLRIPLECTLGEVYHGMLSHIWNNENDNLLNALNIQKKFSTLLLSGAPMKNMLNNLGMLLDKPVVILDLFGEIYEYGYKCGPEDRKLSRETFARMEEVFSGQPDEPYYMDEQCRTDKICIFPIRGISCNTYYLCVLHTEKVPAELSSLMIEEVLLIFGIYFYKNLYLICNKARFKEEFLQILLNRFEKETWTRRQMLTLGERYGFRAGSYYRVIVAQIPVTDQKNFQIGDFTKREERYLLIFQWIEEKLRKKYGNKIMFLPETDRWRYVMIMQEELKDIEKVLKDIYQRIEKGFGILLRFSFGNSTERPEEISRSYMEALEIFQGGSEEKTEGYISYYRPKNIMELLKSVSGNQIQELCLYTLKELAYPKDEMTEELKKTLSTYLDCRCSVSKTAEMMFLHRNTIKYRIKKCEEILNIDFENPNDCFSLQVGLMLSDYRKGV
ncbi:PucR family transcriptional regulator ligand-binding domain-containing protein [Faecalicatena sp. AGMB00832]|uniref:PucR family transcriptional regulator ligand-binding domain-containing protein n=1 Tax=Faecalicatena faecalis TaxID=2726362 RepID=A0ABS6D9N8_9FIRM|nr:PucR family transcriptional regulator [Faecalicatena faecalis]MBU3878325.1 PucR family transcriptional regulator ligand-binding domain-containing protein [Faecalicatena faecalis]